jgi:hypothetical protein
MTEHPTTEQLNDPRSDATLWCRNRMAEKGYELTPQQLVEVRERAFSRLRAALRADGVDVPDDDGELLRLIKPIICHWARSQAGRWYRYPS